jgi:ATP-binding cassette, subfamily B, multidrug efflux pump
MVRNLNAGMQNIREFVSHARPYSGALCFSALCAFLSVFVEVSGPFVIGRVVDGLRWEMTARQLASYALLILAIDAGASLLLFLQRHALNRAWRRVERDLRAAFYAHLLRQPSTFFQAHQTGDLLARASDDVPNVSMFAGPLILDPLRHVLLVVILVSMMLWTNVRLALLLCATMPLISLTMRCLGRHIQARYEETQEYLARIHVRAQENIAGFRVIRAFAREEAEAAAFRSLNNEYAERNLRLSRVTALMPPLSQLPHGLGIMLVIWYGGLLTARGEMTVGEFTAFNLYFARVIWPLLSIGHFANLYRQCRASLKRLSEVFTVAPAIADAPGVREQPPIAGRIEFRGLTFCHPGRREPVLRDINLTIEEGQRVAVLGRTGSGKSTLLNLIPRILDAPPGTVFIDGVPARQYPLAQLRGSIGYVPQQAFLFGDTLAENISFGVEKGERAEVERAAWLAGLADDIRAFPRGLDTAVGERGVTLSGGQRQRTAIARALIRRPSILLLDDALSSVDACTERAVLSRLLGERGGPTTVIVSNRAAAASRADLIVVIDEGRIAERGSHEELLALGGRYAELYRGQAQGADSAAP